MVQRVVLPSHRMTTYSHLSRAPITEAILDIRVEAGIANALTATQEFADGVRGEFPIQRPIESMETRLEMAPGKPAKAESQTTPIGRICWNTEETRAVQARTDGFSLNHVKRYGSWGDLRGHAREMWPRYVALVKPTTVVRIALRYINKLDFPPGDDIAGHLQTKPLLAPNLPQAMAVNFMRVDVPFHDGRRAIITEATLPATPETAYQSLILDIDAFVSKQMTPGDSALWDEFEALREIKNRCFFESLQTEAWRAYL